jgi:hypothetical protein
MSYSEFKTAKASTCNITFNYTKHDINDTKQINKELVCMRSYWHMKAKNTHNKCYIPRLIILGVDNSGDKPPPSPFPS